MNRFERIVVAILSLNLVATLAVISLLSDLSSRVSKLRGLFFVSELQELLGDDSELLGPKNILKSIQSDVSEIKSDVSKLEN